MKVLPWPGVAGEGDLAAEQAGQLAADRQPEAGAPVEAGRGAVALGEGLEDPLLLLVVDADAGVADGDGEDGGGRSGATGLVLPPVVAVMATSDVDTRRAR